MPKPGEIPFDELNEETKEKLGLSAAGAITASLTALSVVIRALKGLSTREAIWVCRVMISLIIGEREKAAGKRQRKAKKGTVDK